MPSSLMLTCKLVYMLFTGRFGQGYELKRTTLSYIVCFAPASRAPPRQTS